MDLLATMIHSQAVREALESLPKELDDIYDETMKRIEGQIECDRVGSSGPFLDMLRLQTIIA